MEIRTSEAVISRLPRPSASPVASKSDTFPTRPFSSITENVATSIPTTISPPSHPSFPPIPAIDRASFAAPSHHPTNSTSRLTKVQSQQHLPPSFGLPRPASTVFGWPGGGGPNPRISSLESSAKVAPISSPVSKFPKSAMPVSPHSPVASANSPIPHMQPQNLPYYTPRGRSSSLVRNGVTSGSPSPSPSKAMSGIGMPGLSSSRPVNDASTPRPSSFGLASKYSRRTSMASTFTNWSSHLPTCPETVIPPSTTTTSSLGLATAKDSSQILQSTSKLNRRVSKKVSSNSLRGSPKNRSRPTTPSKSPKQSGGLNRPFARAPSPTSASPNAARVSLLHRKSLPILEGLDALQPLEPMQQSQTKRQAVSVTVRLRPLTDEQQSTLGRLGASSVWTANQSNGTITLQPNLPSMSSGNASISAGSRKHGHTFGFDHVFDGSDNRSIYTQVVRPLVSACLEGYHGTVFAYGQTSSGKTYTMTGTPETPGVTPQAIHDLFTSISSPAFAHRKFAVHVSYLEIYNESINDLISTDGAGGPEPQVRDDKRGGTVIAGLCEELVDTYEQACDVLDRGNRKRRVAETDWNDRSSRSHTILRLRVTSTGPESADTPGDDTESVSSEDGEGKRSSMYTLTSQLALIDLAGSEKASTDSNRRKEGSYINRSLLTLGTVISRLADLSKKSNAQGGASPAFAPSNGLGHIPYRDSKLTRILQPSLSGRGHISVICTISGDVSNGEETLNTLKFAARAKQVKVKPEVDKEWDDKAEIRRLRRENENLKKRIRNLRGSETWDSAVSLLPGRDESNSPPITPATPGETRSAPESPDQTPAISAVKQDGGGRDAKWKDHVIRQMQKGEVMSALEILQQHLASNVTISTSSRPNSRNQEDVSPTATTETAWVETNRNRQVSQPELPNTRPIKSGSGEIKDAATAFMPSGRTSPTATSPPPLLSMMRHTMPYNPALARRASTVYKPATSNPRNWPSVSSAAQGDTHKAELALIAPLKSRIMELERSLGAERTMRLNEKIRNREREKALADEVELTKTELSVSQLSKHFNLMEEQALQEMGRYH